MKPFIPADGSRPPRRGARRRPRLETSGISAAHLAIRDVVRRTYERCRSEYESLLAGRPVRYKLPRYYDRSGDLLVDDDESAVVQRGRQSEWDRLVKFLVENRVDPELYVRISFEPEQLKLERPPEPFQLRSAERLHAYLEARDSMGDVIAAALESQRTLATTEICYLINGGRTNVSQATLTVLSDESLELSPLFRYCLARSMVGVKFQRLAREYLRPAILQFSYYEGHYAEHWNRWLPCGFVEQARKLYKRYQRQL